MGHRNMSCTTQMIGLEMDRQGQSYLHLQPEPCIISRGLPNIPPPDIQTVIAVPVNASNLDAHHPPERALFYGMPPSHLVHHHPYLLPNLDLGVVAPSNLHVPYMNPLASIPLNQGDQFSLSRNYEIFGSPIDDYGVNSPFMDDARGLYKRKFPEGNPAFIHHLNVLASSSSLVTPSNGRPTDGVASVEDVFVTQNSPRGYRASAIGEAGLHRSVQNRASIGGLDLVLAHNPNHPTRGTYIGQPFIAPPQWVDQRLSSSNSVDASAPGWTGLPPIPFMHGSNVNGVPVENSGMVPQRYHETPNNRSSSLFLYPPFAHIRQNSLHQPSSPFQVMGSQEINVLPQAPPAPYGIPASYALQCANPPEDGFSMRLRQASFQPTALRMHRPHYEVALPETTPRRHNRPHLRVLPTDGVALLEFPDSGELVDHHSDLRLDIEDMSYEDLLELGEWIGTVSTGLSEETIRTQLKTKPYLLSPASINLEESVRMDQEPDSCIICKEAYKSQEIIATLDCGHEYHANCLKTWLRLKNICPICKSEALTTGKKGKNE